GSDLLDATNATLELSRVSVADVGVYRVIVSADGQPVFSQTASLTLFTPAFLDFPQTQSILEDQSLTLIATVIGAPPLQLQWYLDGHPIAGATNATLSFRNVQLTDAGSYQLGVQNDHTNVLSPAMMLTVWQRPRIVTDRGANVFVREIIS